MVDTDGLVSLPAVLQGRYRIGPVLGRGGASVVYRARDILLGREVAIKVFTARAATSQQLRAQEGEARILGGLNHPALVALLDAGVDLTDATAPQLFLIMEYVDGLDLRHHLRQNTLTAFEVSYLAWDLLAALQYVHERGIIHRDLKPANVLLTAAQARPSRGKLADFGIALIAGSAVEPAEETIGTAAYLSPEQVEGQPLGPETDIYSLGLVLLEACTGRVAFPGTVVESAFARLDRDPQIPTDLPVELAEILRKMTARQPADRPTAEQAVTAFRQVIVAHLGGQRPNPADPESARVAAAQDLNLLNSAPDVEFDRMTALAAQIFDVPVAVISIVGEDRVWLKSRHGIEITDLDREQGLGATGSLHDTTLVIEDVTTDPRTAQLPESSTPGFRFYAGVPLVTANGHNLGSFTIADTRPRKIDQTQITTLEHLAALALHVMELRGAARRVVLGGLQKRD